MGSIHTDMSEAPLYQFIVDGQPTFAQVEQHLREYRGVITRGRPYSALFDVRTAGMVDARSRKAYADFLNAHATDMKVFCKGAAFVLTSSLLQGAITAVLWLAPLPFPYRTFTDLDEARTWLRSSL
jgi:hypothetical protein